LEDAPTALVTGANAGIGFETALGLARAGFQVVMAGRDAGRLELASRTIAERAGVAAPEIAVADFASLDQVRRLAAHALTTHERLDLLVNNAGLIAPSFRRSADGYELTMAVNHLAPFLLTNLLLDRLRASAPARIVTVASQAHRGAQIDLATLVNPPDWSPLRAYGRSKLCNILFTRALARRLAGSGVTTACLHPGVIATKIGNNAGAIAGWGWRLVKPFLTSPEQGAATSLFLSTTPDLTPFHGAYVVDKRVTQPDRPGRDDALAERLWEESARLVGLEIAAAPAERRSPSER
jgi:NAD(P)-dependent dehydrogenase (short-subunit alcohol dehydrogenase family)